MYGRPSERGTALWRGLRSRCDARPAGLDSAYTSSIPGQDSSLRCKTRARRPRKLPEKAPRATRVPSEGIPPAPANPQASLSGSPAPARPPRQTQRAPRAEAYRALGERTSHVNSRAAGRLEYAQSKGGVPEPARNACGCPGTFPWESYSVAAAFWPALMPNTVMSQMALPPMRLAPWMPPVTSPAANRPGIFSPRMFRAWESPST